MELEQPVLVIAKELIGDCQNCGCMLLHHIRGDIMPNDFLGVVFFLVTAYVCHKRMAILAS